MLSNHGTEEPMKCKSCEHKDVCGNRQSTGSVENRSHVKQPAVGEWEKKELFYSCSVCGKTCPYNIVADMIVYWPCNYCPNCGAKMNGEAL